MKYNLNTRVRIDCAAFFHLLENLENWAMGLLAEKKADSSLRTLRVESESLFCDDNVLTVSVEVPGELPNVFLET